MAKEARTRQHEQLARPEEGRRGPLRRAQRRHAPEARPRFGGGRPHARVQSQRRERRARPREHVAGEAHALQRNRPADRAPCPFCRQSVLLGELTSRPSVHEASMARRRRYRAAIAQRLEAVEREIAESSAQGESSETERRIAPPPAPARAASDTASDLEIARALSRDTDAALAASLQAEEAAAASLPRPPP